MKPSVTLLEGYHVTAAEKRTILDVIEYQRKQDPETWGKQWLGFKKSPKDYAVSPDPEKPGRYAVLIRTKYRNDRGEPAERTSRVLIETKGVTPLPHPAYETQDLFAPKTREAAE